MGISQESVLVLSYCWPVRRTLNASARLHALAIAALRNFFPIVAGTFALTTFPTCLSRLAVLALSNDQNDAAESAYPVSHSNHSLFYSPP